MKRRVANCPACGGRIEFRLNTGMVTVCEYCHSVVARADKRLEDHGKVADVVETGSPLSLGMTGKFGNKSFEVVGRVQYQHPAGGVWNEWYLQFPSERVRWLAEAQGKFFLMTERNVSNATPLPAFEALEVGKQVTLPGGKTLSVTERGVARCGSAEGDIPWDFRPNAEHRFVDLMGADREVATLEFGTAGTQCFLGRQIEFAELGLPVIAYGQTDPQSANTAALRINCPQCAGPLSLAVPDLTERVACPNCRALLDCKAGALQYLETLKTKAEHKPQIPLGSVGTLFNTEYTVIGYMERYAVYEGKKYPWTEYLLYAPTIGFRWLVCNKGHWSFVEPMTTMLTPGSKSLFFDGHNFQLYDRGIAHVRFIAGEFYWRVTANEKVETADYIAPPYMLSFEKSATESSQELNVSRGIYLPVEELEAAFHLRDLPRPWSIGTIQPLPQRGDVWVICGGLLILLLALYPFVGGPLLPGETDGKGFYFFVSLISIVAWPAIMQVVRHGYEVNRWSDSDYSPYAQE